MVYTNIQDKDIRFLTNFHKSKTDSIVSFANKIGLQYVIKDDAFNYRGEILPESSALFIPSDSIVEQKRTILQFFQDYHRNTKNKTAS